VRGANVMSGYYRNPEAYGGRAARGVALHGDIGRFDPGGYLYISGRTKTSSFPTRVRTFIRRRWSFTTVNLPGVRDWWSWDPRERARRAGMRRVVPHPAATEAQIGGDPVRHRSAL